MPCKCFSQSEIKQVELADLDNVTCKRTYEMLSGVKCCGQSQPIRTYVEQDFGPLGFHDGQATQLISIGIESQTKCPDIC